TSGSPVQNTTHANCSITITMPRAPLTLACAATTGEVGVAYSSSLVATGGVEPYAFSIASSMPAGLLLNPATGAITGTPVTPAAFTFTARVLDSSGNPTQNMTSTNCTITIAPPLALSCAAGTGQVGIPYNSSLSTSGGVAPYTFSVS